jgi:SagB-type dehydrogenase family enzyme
VSETVDAYLGAAEVHRRTDYLRDPGGGSDPRLIRSWLARRTEAKPPPFKTYDDCRVVYLPTALRGTRMRTWEALRRLDPRTGHDERGGDPVDVVAIARLLFQAAGVVRVLVGPETSKGRWFRAAGSAHNLSPLELYLVCGDVGGLASGVYHYGSLTHTLSLIRAGDHRGRLARAIARAQVPILYVVVTAVPWRTVWRDGDRGFRNVFLDAGTLLSHLLTSARVAPSTVASLDVAFVDEAVDELLALDGVAESSIVVASIGPPAWAPPPSPRLTRAPVGSLGETHHLAFVTQALREGVMRDARGVRAWRSRAQAFHGERLPTLRRTGRDGSMSVDRAIRARSSTRRFEARAIDGAAARAILPLAVGPVTSDATAAGGTLLEHRTIVHAVDGIAPGVHDLDGRLVTGCASVDQRMSTARLSMGQLLARDAALVAVHATSLPKVFDILGDRGYRAALLEAGSASGRLQLAAAAIGWGATALVCYDDEMRAVLGEGIAPLMLTALGHPAHAARPGGSPRHPSRLRRIPTPGRTPEEAADL